MDKILLADLKQNNELLQQKLNDEIMDKNAFIQKMEDFESQIWEGLRGYVPNPDLTAMNFKCDFKHKKCRKEPNYTDGKLCYCWAHSIMIQQDIYK